MKTNLKEKSTVDKIMLILRIITSIVVVVFASLQLFGVWEQAINFAAPLMGVILLIQSIQEWKQHRGVAGFSLSAAVFIFGCSIVVWFAK